MFAWVYSECCPYYSLTFGGAFYFSPQRLKGAKEWWEGHIVYPLYFVVQPLISLAKAFTYNKKEKLKSRKQLEALFGKGKTLLQFPVKVFYLLPEVPLDSVVKAGVGASSRQFKKAVQRNRIKRLLREAYRLNKEPLHHFLQIHNRQLIAFFLYVDKGMPQQNIIEQKMPVILDKLMKQLVRGLENKDESGIDQQNSQ